MDRNDIRIVSLCDKNRIIQYYINLTRFEKQAFGFKTRRGPMKKRSALIVCDDFEEACNDVLEPNEMFLTLQFCIH